MPVTLYHLNPETERIGVCKAERSRGSEQRCPFGSYNPHFGSQEEAQSYYENELEAEYGLFGEVSSSAELSLQRDAVARRLNLLSRDTLRSMVEERWLREGWTEEETEERMASGAPFYVNYGRDQEITLELRDESTQRTFTKGACSVLAHELSRTTGWPVAVFTDPNFKGAWQGHVAVRTPDGRYLDATGVTDTPTKPFGAKGESWVEEEMDTAGLVARLGRPRADGSNEFSGLPLLERFTAAKLTYDLLDSEGLLKD